MVTTRQIEANRLNARKSTGPRTDLGKAVSRQNAMTHGLAGKSAQIEAVLQGQFDSRRQDWAASINPQSAEADFALDRAVAASIRIERCEDALDALTVAQTTRARLTWDEDRRVEAATLFGRLAKDPILVAAQLASTRHGAELMIATWDRLGEALFAKGEWSDFEASMALDLLGLPAGLREGRTPLDPPQGTDRVEWLRTVAVGAITRLERRKAESLDTLDGLDRRHAEAAALVVLSKPAALLLRYERDAWRRMRESLKVARSPVIEADGLAPRSVDPDLVARVDALMTERTRPAPPEAIAEVQAEDVEPVGRVASPVATPPVVSTSRPLNRHQRRAQRVLERCA